MTTAGGASFTVKLRMLLDTWGGNERPNLTLERDQKVPEGADLEAACAAAMERANQLLSLGRIQETDLLAIMLLALAAKLQTL